MADAVFTVEPGGRRRSREYLSNDVRAVAERLKRELEQATPADTGAMRGGWFLAGGRDPGTWLIYNLWPQYMYVEFGTSRMPARPFVGPVLARWRR